jgi:hypothetical protein
MLVPVLASLLFAGCGGADLGIGNAVEKTETTPFADEPVLSVSYQDEADKTQPGRARRLDCHRPTDIPAERACRDIRTLLKLSAAKLRDMMVTCTTRTATWQVAVSGVAYDHQMSFSYASNCRAALRLTALNRFAAATV